MEYKIAYNRNYHKAHIIIEHQFDDYWSTIVDGERIIVRLSSEYDFNHIVYSRDSLFHGNINPLANIHNTVIFENQFYLVRRSSVHHDLIYINKNGLHCYDHKFGFFEDYGNGSMYINYIMSISGLSPVDKELYEYSLNKINNKSNDETNIPLAFDKIPEKVKNVPNPPEDISMVPNYKWQKIEPLLLRAIYTINHN